MKPMKSKINSMFSLSNNNSVGNGGGRDVGEWEVRPGGMLVQKRDVNQSSVSIPTIKVRVKYGSSYHEILINSQASFGELKKMLAERTGLHPQDQKLIFKKKERDSKAYLDVARVKDGSKIVLVEDIESRQRRCLEMLKNAKVEKASKSLAEITLEVNKLAGQVTACRGGKVTGMDMVKLTEMLMTNLVKLDEIVAEGDLQLQRSVQVRRVQKHIETLDTLKLQNGGKNQWQQEAHSTRQMSTPIKKQHVQPRQRDYTGEMPVQQQPESIVVSTQWETFD